MTPPKSSDTWTISGVTELGSTCRSRIRGAEMPSARQLSTYGRPATEAAWPRISLVYQGHQVTEIAMTRLVRLGGSTAAKARASSSGGDAQNKSVHPPTPH